MYSSPTRVRMEREAGRRGNAAVVISTLLSLAVVGVAVAAVAYFVLRAPSSTVDSAERLEPVGTAISAPTEAPALPTPIPTPASEPEPAAPGFSGDAPAVSALPTAAAPEVAGPTPTPRVVALPTAAPVAAAAALSTVVPTIPAPIATLPPAAAAVPVVALAPVESAPPAPTTAPRDNADQPAAEATRVRDDDPFDIFSEDELPRIVPVTTDTRDRVREIQDEARGRKENRDEDESNPAPVIVIPTIAARPASDLVTRNDDGTVEVVMPDVEATVAAIATRTADPNRNPNINRGNGSQTGGEDNNNGRREPASGPGSKKKNDRNKRTPTPVSRPANNRDTNDSENGRGNGQPEKDCDDPFANMPENMRPKDWPFDKCQG